MVELPCKWSNPCGVCNRPYTGRPGYLRVPFLDASFDVCTIVFIPARPLASGRQPSALGRGEDPGRTRSATVVSTHLFSLSLCIAHLPIYVSRTYYCVLVDSYIDRLRPTYDFSLRVIGRHRHGCSRCLLLQMWRCDEVYSTTYW